MAVIFTFAYSAYVADINLQWILLQAPIGAAIKWECFAILNLIFIIRKQITIEVPLWAFNVSFHSYFSNYAIRF